MISKKMYEIDEIILEFLSEQIRDFKEGIKRIGIPSDQT